MSFGKVKLMLDDGYLSIRMIEYHKNYWHAAFSHKTLCATAGNKH